MERGGFVNDFESSLNDLLVDTFNNILKYEDISLRKITDYAITVTEAHLIDAIAKNDGKATVSEIASILGVSLPTATVAIKKLDKKGFVAKSTCTDDGRRAIITLTKNGKKVYKAHSFFHRKMVRNISSTFKDKEKEVLLSAINKLSEFFKEKVEA